ncbi:MAG TPA: ABC transporter permease [Xanthobacteraceae bacterium]|nr:ABC transporter permease [Xanthobacteraceae bacterium]
MTAAQAELPAHRAPAARHGFSYATRVRLTRWIIFAGLLLAWEVYGQTLANPRLISPPSGVLYALFSEILADGRIVTAIFESFREVIVAYVASILLGLAIGLGVGWSSFGRRSFFPIVLLLYAIPQVILLPLFVLIFGIGPACKIAFGISHGVFPIIVNVIAGMRNVNPLYLRSAASMGGSAVDVARHVYFPHMVPSLFTGLRLGMTMTLLGVILAELYVSTQGIGYWTKVYAENFDPAPLLALIAVLALMAIILNSLVRVGERRFTRWRN